MSSNDSIHGLDDTVRVAMGFIMGGFTAVYLDVGYILIATIAAAIVLSELLIGFISMLYTAHETESETENDD